jgi:hypothetical protein
MQRGKLLVSSDLWPTLYTPLATNAKLGLEVKKKQKQKRDRNKRKLGRIKNGQVQEVTGKGSNGK